MAVPILKVLQVVENAMKTPSGSLYFDHGRAENYDYGTKLAMRK
jgi:hypothetical protein